MVESDLTVVVSGHRAPPPRVLGAAAIAETHGTATTLASSRKACAQRLGKLERSSRSRGLLYLAAAVHAAAAHGVRRVDVPENGQLAVNPPLTPSRLGALSTRSVHPWTLHQLNELIDAVGGDVVVYNPLAHLTKGEVCLRGLENGLTETDLFATISCGRHAPLGNRNCGSCFPCLVRRSGLLHALGEDRSDYAYDPREPNRAGDLLAVQSWLNQEFSVRDLIADMSWPPDTPPASVMPVLERGRAELAAMVDHLGRGSTPVR